MNREQLFTYIEKYIKDVKVKRVSKFKDRLLQSLSAEIRLIEKFKDNVVGISELKQFFYSKYKNALFKTSADNAGIRILYFIISDLERLLREDPTLENELSHYLFIRADLPKGDIRDKIDSFISFAHKHNIGKSYHINIESSVILFLSYFWFFQEPNYIPLFTPKSRIILEYLDLYNFKGIYNGTSYINFMSIYDDLRNYFLKLFDYDLDTIELSVFLNWLYSKVKKPAKYWIFTIEDSEQAWIYFKSISTIGAKYKEIPSLDDIPKDRLIKKFFETYPKATKKKLDYLVNLKKILPGDTVIAIQGSYIIGIGNIVSKYYYKESDKFCPHNVDVNWYDITKREIVIKKYKSLSVNALITISKQEFNRLLNTSLISNPFIENFRTFIRSKNYYFPDDIIINLYLSLKTYPIVLLSGISGTGKSKMAQLFAQFMTNENKQQYLFLTANPEWNSPKDIFGYYDPVTERYEITPIMKLILKASKDYNINKDKADIYFIIIDEMNLSKIDNYFCTFLSHIESRYIDKQGRFAQEEIYIHNLNYAIEYLDENNQRYIIPPNITIPYNVYFIGTVEEDSLKSEISKKFLDRINIIDFNVIDLAGYEKFSRIKVDKDIVTYVDRKIINDFTYNGSFFAIYDFSDIYRKDYYNRLKEIYDIMKNYNIYFGYRVINSILLYLYNAKNSLIKMDLNKAFDIQISQRILPQLKKHSDKKDLILELLKYFAQKDLSMNRLLELKDNEAKYPVSFRYTKKLLSL